MANGIFNAKDYYLTNLTLLSSVATFDLKESMIEVSYSEDMFSNFITGYVAMVEASGYIETLALNGTEYLRLTFSKTGDKTNEIDAIFRVYKVGNRKPEGTMYKESYFIYFCSEELMLSEQYKISKRYKNSTISKNIKNILEQHLKSPASKLNYVQNFEETYGNYDFVIPNLKPFDAINFMTKYARPNAKNPGADMMFFENRYGFNFKSLQTMMSQTPYYTYTYKPKNLNSNDLNSDVYNVTTYEILDSFDTLNGVSTGTFANQLISLNPLTREKKVTNFDYLNYQSKAKNLNPGKIIDNSTNRFGDKLNETSQAMLKLIFTNFDSKSTPAINALPGAMGNDIYAETFIPYRTAQLGLANYTRVRLSVPGDPNITIGKIVTFNLLSKQVNSKELDKYYSGNYFVTGVRHILGGAKNLLEYKTILEITKESTPVSYPSNNNGIPLWNNAIKGII
jgi:hypothetical protein